jgi:hypothetical protein
MGQMPRKFYFDNGMAFGLIIFYSIHAPASRYLPSASQRCWPETIDATDSDPIAHSPILPSKPTV